MFLTLYNYYSKWMNQKTEVELLKEDIIKHLNIVYRNQKNYDTQIKKLIKSNNRMVKDSIELIKKDKQFNLRCPTAAL